MHSSEISDKHVFSGAGALSQLDNLTEEFEHIWLFADKFGFGPCGAAAYFEELGKKKSIQRVEYAGKALPIEDIEAQYRDFRTGKPTDVIIAVGGGTVIDLAKIIAIAYSNRCEKAEEVLDDRTLENTIPLIFIPTTAGTGSETTSFAVVYRDKVKISIERQSILPRYIILDPLLLRSLPGHVLHATVLDALAQATESVWAVGSTEESKVYSRRAIPLILYHIDKENSIDRLRAFQAAAYWAGKAINISKTTLSHSISYPITAYFGVPHGIAVFLTLARVAELNYGTSVETKQEKLDIERVGSDFALLFRLYGVEDIRELTVKLSGVMVRLGVEARLRHYGIGEEDLEFLASHALTKGRSDNNPRKMSESEVLALLREIY